MYTCHFADFLHFSRKNKLLLLAFFSLSGILLGVTAAYSADLFLFSLMRRMLFNSVSIVGLIVVACLPFLITAVIVLLSKSYLFFLHCLFKNFSYAFVRSFICISFAHAGWLVGAVLLFTDTIVMCVLHWFWVRHLQGIQKSAIRDLLICLILSLIACFIDYIWVSDILPI